MHNVYHCIFLETNMDNDDLDFEPEQKPKKKSKHKKRIYEDAMDDDQLLDYFKHDHGLDDHYTE